MNKVISTQLQILLAFVCTQVLGHAYPDHILAILTLQALTTTVICLRLWRWTREDV
jgi:hypothetical protein